MNKKGFILASGVAILAVSLVGGLMANNGGGLMTHSNELSPAQKLTPVTQGAHLPGNSIYMQVQKDHYGDGWDQASAKLAVYFFAEGTSKTKYSAWSGFLSFRYENSGYGKVWEGKVPNIPAEGLADGVTEWTTMIGARISSSAESPSFDNGILWKQTADITIKSGLTYRNEIEVYELGSGSSNAYFVGAGERLKYLAWYADWSNPSGELCQDDGSTNETNLSASWQSSKTYYNSYLGNDVKAYFSNVTADKSLSTTDGTGAGLAARYDHIVSAHSFENFASR